MLNWCSGWRGAAWCQGTRCQGTRCQGNQCLRCCGVCLYWLPRVSMPLAIAWGTASNAAYARGLPAFWRAVLTVLGTVAGACALVAYTQVWRVGPGYVTELGDLVRGDAEASVGLDGGLDGGLGLGGGRDGSLEGGREGGREGGIERTSLLGHGAAGGGGRGRPAGFEACVEAKHDGGARFCSKCCAFKPDRTHHCRQCGVCVLRMDHHCPWFSTCIGLRNHKLFVQFLWYVWALCVCADCVSVPTLASFFGNEEYNTRYLGANFVFFFMLATVFNIVLLVFGGYTTYLLALNRTTLESLEPSAYRTSLPASHWRYRRPPTRESLGNLYDVGVRANACQVMGTTWCEWLLPIQPRLATDGRAYPVNEELRLRAEERAQTEIAMHQRKRQWDIEAAQRHA